MLVSESRRVRARNRVSDEKQRPCLRIPNAPQRCKNVGPSSKLGEAVTRLPSARSEPWRCWVQGAVTGWLWGDFLWGVGGGRNKIAELCASEKMSLSGSSPSLDLAHLAQSDDLSDPSLCFVLPPSSSSADASLLILAVSRETENGVCCLLTTYFQHFSCRFFSGPGTLFDGPLPASPLPWAEPVSLPGPGAGSSWEEPALASAGSQ